VTHLVALLTARFGRVGFNLIGATSVAAYDARVAPPRRLGPRARDARGVLVIGNGGDAFWRAFRAAVPYPDGDDPLDRFTRASVDAALVDLPSLRCCFPFDGDAPDFQMLAELAGLGRPSLVGVLVHPEYGPWMALRAAVLMPDEPTASRPADGFDPCPTCVERPCIAACPIGAVGGGGWDVHACTDHRLATEANCAAGCTARLDCVYGQPHRYPPDALAFHQAAARRSMAAHRVRQASAARKV
jgi:hypothetical protein